MSSDQKVEDLKAQVAELTARIERLEAEKGSSSSSKSATSEAMRMILIGPPGAGQ